MSEKGRNSDRPGRSRTLTEKGAYAVHDKVVKLIQEGEKTYNEAHAVIKEAFEGRTEALESSFENLMEALGRVKKDIEEKFDLLALTKIQGPEFIEQMSRIAGWLEDIEEKRQQLALRFKETTRVDTIPPLWQLSAGQLLEEPDRRKAGSVLSTTSTARARAEAVAAKKRMELERAKADLLAEQIEEDAAVELKMLEMQRATLEMEKIKKKRQIEMEQMKADIEFQVAQAKLEALEEGSLRATSRAGDLEYVKEAPFRCVEGRTSYEDRKNQFKKEDYNRRRLLVPGISSPLPQHQERSVHDAQDMMRAMLYGVPKLVPFTGKPEDFCSFMAAWLSTAGASGGNPAYKLQLLLTNLDEKSRNLLLHCSYLEPEKGYTKALDLLYERFGRGDVLVDSFMEKLKKLPKIKMGEAEKLEAFSDLLDQSVLALEELSRRPGNADFVSMASTVRNVAELLCKLPYGLREKYVKRTGENSSSLKELRRFLKTETKEVNNPVLRVCKEMDSKERDVKTTKKDPGNKKSAGSFATEVIKCFICENGSHPAFKCKQFKQMKAKERIGLLKKAGRCFNCFTDGHRSNDCSVASFCKRTDCGWSSPHSWFMHDQRESARGGEDAKPQKNVRETTKTEGNKQEKPQDEVVNACGTVERKAFFQVVPVRVWTSKRPERSVTCWAMLDTCSSTHFGCKKLQELLNVSGRKKEITLRTVNGTKSMSMLTSNIHVAGLEKNEEFLLRNVKFQDSNQLSLSAVPNEADGQRWPQLKPLVGKVDHDEVLLLIGLEAEEVFSQKAAKGPYLVETGLGTAIQGLIGTGTEGCESVNFIEVEDEKLEDRVKRFFEVEDCQALYDDTKAMSMEDRQAIDMINRSIKKENGRYEVRVPWRSLPPDMPNNRHQALQRLNGQKKKFLQDPEGFREYAEAISKYEKDGLAERVPDVELAAKEGKASWLCHHGVKHERKPLRIVFNASKLCQGKALNTEILQGPDLLSKLIGILLRFRKSPVAVSADIKAFFHQVCIPREDFDFQRYLWFEDSDLNKKIIELRMKVHLFGGISSQTCSVAALQRCIEDAKAVGLIDERFAEEAMKSFYCDDFLGSFENVEEAREFSLKLREVLAEGGFSLVKFISTDPKVLEDIPEEDVAESCRGVCSIEGVETSALGIRWDVGKDILTFRVPSKPKGLCNTKREVLSLIASVFDPLGMLGPVVATAKMILSMIFQKGLDWDEVLPPEEKKLVESWTTSLSSLESFFLPRCVKMLSFQKVELHLFSDGAEPGYGCCAYLVHVEGMNRITSFVMSKSKVCSKKGKLTTPKVELCAALLASRMARVILREQGGCDRVCFWTDSMSTFRMIKNDKTRFKVFEANRLEEIRSCTDVSAWKYVPGKQNPSDILTRPFHLTEEYNAEHPFFKGPPFLGSDEEYWPKQPEDQMIKQEDECHVVKCTELMSVVENIFPRLSSWSKLKKFVAVMLRLQRLKKGLIKKGCLSVEEMNEAETFIYKIVQEHHFSEEIECVRSGKPLSKSNCLAKYTPFLEGGLLRVSGRLQEADLNFDQKHPIILPKKGHVTELLVRTLHQRNLHGTPQMVLNGLRQKYHIPDALRLVKKVIGKCFECKRYTQRVGEQIMSNLPPERMAVLEPPFTHTGCDVAGPFFVKRARKTQKRYICLFTCLTVRAVHLEVLENLEADSFINALRRFLARRGPIKTLRSDNGLNFRGGEREIREAIEEWNKSNLGARPEFRNEGILWKFQTPTASSHSGVWERLIRSMRCHLRHVIKQHEVAEEVFLTLVTEVEAILNSRPLVPVSEDPNDLTALTPSMLCNNKQTCSISPGLFSKEDLCLRKRWRQTQAFVEFFWKRFTKEYLTTLLSRQKWFRQKRSFAVGDMIMIADSILPRSEWPIGRVIEVYPGRDTKVRSCKVRTKFGVYDRPITKLVLLEASD